MRAALSQTLGARYWTALSIASVFGAGLGDVISRDLHAGHWRGVLPLAVLFWLILRGRRVGWIGAEAAYWSAVSIVRAGATNVADLATHDVFVLNNGMVIAGLAALMLAALLWPRRSGAAPAATPAGLPDTSGPYWLVLFLAGTLGTVLGDDSSDRLGLPGASILLCTLLAGTFGLRASNGLPGKAGYWITVLAARTAGTSLGDLIADRTPLGLAGSTAAEGLLLLLVLLAWPRPTGAG